MNSTPWSRSGIWILYKLVRIRYRIVSFIPSQRKCTTTTTCFHLNAQSRQNSTKIICLCMYIEKKEWRRENPIYSTVFSNFLFFFFYSSYSRCVHETTGRSRKPVSARSSFGVKGWWICKRSDVYTSMEAERVAIPWSWATTVSQ